MEFLNTYPLYIYHLSKVAKENESKFDENKRNITNTMKTCPVS